MRHRKWDWYTLIGRRITPSIMSCSLSTIFLFPVLLMLATNQCPLFVKKATTVTQCLYLQKWHTLTRNIPKTPFHGLDYRPTQKSGLSNAIPHILLANLAAVLHHLHIANHRHYADNTILVPRENVEDRDRASSTSPQRSRSSLVFHYPHGLRGHVHQ